MTNVEIQGVGVTDRPADRGEWGYCVGKAWADVRTQLAVRTEIEGIGGATTVRWLMEFKWQEAVDPATFEPNIPSDYTLLG